MLNWSIKYWSLFRPIFYCHRIRIQHPFALLSTKLPYFFHESELTEDFIRGWGPGGQALNKTCNCVVLRHKPTGLLVKCQDTCDLVKNREIARKRLNDKLDVYLHGEESAVMQKKRAQEEKERQRKSRNKKRLAEKLAFKAREGLDESSLSNKDDLDV